MAHVAYASDSIMSSSEPGIRRETRVFAHAAAESQSSIYDSIVQAERASTASGRPSTSSFAPGQNNGFLEVYPRVASRPPRLLSELEALLIDRLRANDKTTSLWSISGKERDVRLAANLSLDAHRQVFAAFALGFTTYTQLLAGIQAEFEQSLCEGLRCSLENVHMRDKIREEEVRREQAGLEVRTKILSEELPVRHAVSAQLLDLKERSARSLRRAAAAERELAFLQREEQQMRAACDQMRDTNRRVQELTLRDAKWGLAVASAPAMTLRVGAMTAEDEAFLEAELGAGTHHHPAAATAAATMQRVLSSTARADTEDDEGRSMTPGLFVGSGGAAAAAALLPRNFSVGSEAGLRIARQDSDFNSTN